MRTRTQDVTVIAALLVTMWPSDAQAYLDPGTGSLVIQAVVATLAAAAYGFRNAIGRLFALVVRRRGGQPPDGHRDVRS